MMTTMMMAVICPAANAIDGVRGWFFTFRLLTSWLGWLFCQGRAMPGRAGLPVQPVHRLAASRHEPPDVPAAVRRPTGRRPNPAGSRAGAGPTRTQRHPRRLPSPAVGAPHGAHSCPPPRPSHARQAWHPIMGSHIDGFIPNDTRIGGDTPATLVLTGCVGRSVQHLDSP